ncbi:hypothetical protein ACI65C_013495 [Semiaphis heraclei]
MHETSDSEDDHHYVAAIIKHVIGASHKDDLAAQLKISKFSILTDESTDIGTVKTSCVVVRYNVHFIIDVMSNIIHMTIVVR